MILKKGEEYCFKTAFLSLFFINSEFLKHYHSTLRKIHILSLLYDSMHQADKTHILYCIF